MKVIIHKETGEFGHYLGKGEFATSSIPQVFPDTMDENVFRQYVSSQEGCKLFLENFEIKTIKINIID